jgi:alpha-1,2-mannosyltransferase
VAALAFALRLSAVLHGGGPKGFFGRYDDGVYYSGAVALLSGRMPYRDFVLLHPPGVLLASAPFAEIGRLTHDSTGLASARVAWMGIGALIAVLIMVVTRRFGLPPAASSMRSGRRR